MPVTIQAQVDLCNQALRALGEKPIALPFDDTNPRWLLAAQFYDQVQDETLLEHPWAFATVRTQLTTGGGSPAWGWLYAYALPPDYLGMQRTDDSATYQREGAVILTNDNPLYITYTARITDVTKWPAYFVAAFTAALTAAFAEQITGQLDKHKVWFEIAGRRLERAKDLNDREGSPIPAQSLLGEPEGRDLLNQALRPLGDLPRQTRFLLADRFFEQIWERLLTQHFWNFATERVELTTSVGGAIWHYTYRYALPADYLAIQRTDDSMVYQREGDFILSNDNPFRLTYTKKVTDVSKWPAYFKAAFVGMLTAELAAQVPEHHKNLDAWLKVADRLLQDARVLDGKEGSPVQAQGVLGTAPGRDLVNQALRPLGDVPVQTRFLLADRFFGIVWERLLVSHFWNFATARVVLTPAVGITPAWGFAHAFALPVDYLQMQRVQTGIRYQREGQHLVSDEPTLPLTYTKKVEDVLLWPSYFTTAFIAALTAEFAAQFPEHHKNLPAWLANAERLLKAAKTLDGQEGSSPILEMRDLVVARFGGGSRGGWR
jgi:hypothetical protein